MKNETALTFTALRPLIKELSEEEGVLYDKEVALYAFNEAVEDGIEDPTEIAEYVVAQLYAAF